MKRAGLVSVYTSGGQEEAKVTNIDDCRVLSKIDNRLSIGNLNYRHQPKLSVPTWSREIEHHAAPITANAAHLVVISSWKEARILVADLWLIARLAPLVVSISLAVCDKSPHPLRGGPFITARYRTGAGSPQRSAKTSLQARRWSLMIVTGIFPFLSSLNLHH